MGVKMCWATQTHTRGLFDTCCQNLPPPARPHSLILSFIYFDNEFKVQTEGGGGVKEWKEKERGGRVHSSSSSEPTLWPYDPAQGQTVLPLPLLSLIPHSLSYKTFKHMQVFKGMLHTATNHRTCHHPLCLICLFCTLHTNTDGLSIDFDLFWLGLALCASMLCAGVGVGLSLFGIELYNNIISKSSDCAAAEWANIS